MKRRLTLLALATLAVAAFVGMGSAAAPSPSLAGGATQISGVAFFDERDACDSASVGADFALLMSGDLESCLYKFVETSESSPSGTYRETGTELFVDSEGAGSFETTYRVEAKFEDVASLAGTIFERCQHPIVQGSGTASTRASAGDWTSGTTSKRATTLTRATCDGKSRVPRETWRRKSIGRVTPAEKGARDAAKEGPAREVEPRSFFLPVFAEVTESRVPGADRA